MSAPIDTPPPVTTPVVEGPSGAPVVEGPSGPVLVDGATARGQSVPTPTTPLPGLFANLPGAPQAGAPQAGAPQAGAPRAAEIAQPALVAQSPPIAQNELLVPTPATPLPVPRQAAPLAPRTVQCPACAFESADPDWCDRCGAELRARETAPIAPALPTGTRVGPIDAALLANGSHEPEDTASPVTLLTLVERQQVQGTRTRWLARADDGRTFIVQDDPLPNAEPAPTPPPCVWAPVATVQHANHRLRVFAAPLGTRLRQYLEAAPLPLVRALELTLHVADAVMALHASGHALLGLSPDATLVAEPAGEPPRVTFAWDGPYPAFDAVNPTLAPVWGFSPPEAFGRGEGKVVPASDVFVLGALAYYLATGAPLIADLAESGTELPPPCDYAPGLSPGLGPIVRRATARLASRRHATVAELAADLRAAAALLAQRASLPAARVRHVIATDTHVGIAKGRANPTTEDAFFVASSADGMRTLAAVFDGVTHARLGTGRLASSVATQVFADRWARLQHSRLLTHPEPLSPRVAQNLLDSLLRAANDAIVEHANALLPKHAAAAQVVDVAPPSEVMATTAVVALLDGPRLCLANLGDSRAYLAFDGRGPAGEPARVVERLSADHDFGHELLRERKPLAFARAAKGASQLTRFLGRLGPDASGHRFVSVPPDADFHHYVLLPGERLLLCSDGLSDYVGQAESEVDTAICEVLREHRDGPRAAFELVVRANRGGGGDNITCVVIDVACL